MGNRNSKNQELYTWIAFLFLLFVVCTCLADSLLNPGITKQNIVIQEPSAHLGNNKQYEASLFLCESQGKLYFYAINTPLSMWHYNGYLSVFENGSIRRVKKLRENVFASHSGLVYYDSYTDDNSDRDVSCYSIVEDKNSQLVTVSDIGSDRLQHGACFFGVDGTFYVPTSDQRTAFYPIIGDQVNEPVEMQEMYVYGDNTLIVNQDIFSHMQISFESQEENNIVFDSRIISGKASVFPCSDGLLIHSEYRGNLLYFIEGDSGNLIELFTVPCDRSVSAVNVHEDYIFLSLLRYENYDTVFAKRYDNDTVEGTYKIDLRDYSVKKISNKIYNGLYIFDDTGIYACDEGYNIYKLDFEGNQLCTLLEN